MYNVITNLPIDYDFHSKTKKELKSYSLWFDENKEKRLSELISVIKECIGFEDWIADYSPESLKVLGVWLQQNIETEKLSKKEYETIRKSTPGYIDVDDFDLTIKTRSLLVDSGIYFGEVFIKNNRDLEWEQFFSRIKNDSSQGHMVISGFGILDLNPILMLQGVGLGLLDKTYNTNRLFDLYDIWSKDLGSG